MIGQWRRFAAAALLFPCLIHAAPAQASLPRCPAAPHSAPCVEKVDPPNWWSGLPPPMLLLYGRNLRAAAFSVSGDGVSVTRSQISASGHYAFIWLADTHAQPQTLRIGLRSPAGSASVPWQLLPRKPAAHAGISPADVIYLIMTDRFADGDLTNDPHTSQRNLSRGWHGGDFRGVAQHLGYLRQLGVTAVWLTPVYDNEGSPQAYHGYSATDMYRTDPHFGTLADLRTLAAALHRRGMKLVLDTVPNHVGAAHPWAADPPTPDWFHGTPTAHFPASGDFSPLVDPHSTPAARRAVTAGWFANALPDLNQENPLVRQYLIQNVIWWIETTGADGLRYDTFPFVDRAFWRSLDAQLHNLYPHLTEVGEVFGPSPAIASYFAGGKAHRGIDTGLTTPFDYPFFFALRAALAHSHPVPGGPVRHDDMRALEEVLGRDELYPQPRRLVTFLGNHDNTRFMSLPGASLADLRLAFALLATLRGTPQLYYGDEIAMTGGNDPDNRRDFPGGFPGDPLNAFTAAGRTPAQAAMYDWVSSLFRFRQAHPALYNGEQQDIFVDASAFVFVRAADVRHGCTRTGGPRFVIAVNNAREPRTLAIPVRQTALQGCTSFPAELGAGEASPAGPQLTLHIPPKQAVIFAAN